MVDIQSATAEISRGKIERGKGGGRRRRRRRRR